MGALAPRPGQDGDRVRTVQLPHGSFQAGRTGQPDPGPGDEGSRGRCQVDLGAQDVSGDRQDRHPLLIEGRTDGGVEDIWQLLNTAHQLAVDAALGEQILRVSLLEVAAAYLGAGNVRCDREYGHPAAMSIEEAVDQMQVPRTAACCTDRKIARERGLGAGGERGRFLVPHVHPLQGSVAPQCLGKAVERVSR